MPRFRKVFIAIVLVHFVGGFDMSVAAQPQEDPMITETGVWQGKFIEYFKGRAIITFKPGTAIDTISAVLSEKNIEYIKHYPRFNSVKVKLQVNVQTLSTIENLARSQEFEKIEPDFVAHILDILPNEQYGPYFANQWWLENSEDPPLDGDISAKEGWGLERGVTTPGFIPVAVLDSGIATELFEIPGGGLRARPSHEDLSNDPHESTRIVLRENWINPGYPPNPYDENGHGTAIAGILGARTDNSIGVAGASWETVAVWVYKIANILGAGSNYDIMDAVMEAVDDGAKIINLSLGWTQSFLPSNYHTALQYAQNHGVIIVAGAGNHAHWPDNWGIGQLKYPAESASTYDNIIAVGALEKNEHRAVYSQISDALTVSAFGGYASIGEDGTSLIMDDPDIIFTTAPGYPVYLFPSGTKYGATGLTSAAVPQVSALAALVWSVNPKLAYQDVINLITENADPVHSGEYDQYLGYPYQYDYSGDGRNNIVGYGCINLYTTLENVPITGFETTIIPNDPVKILGTEAPPGNYYVRLIWDKHYGDALQYYRVYRSDNSPSNWQLHDIIYQPSSGEYVQCDDRRRVYDGNTYYYKISVWGSEPGGQNEDQYAPSEVKSVTIPGGDPEPSPQMETDTLPDELELMSNYPNPFNPSTQIKFGLPAATHVCLQIMNIRGQTVRVLVDEEKPAGWFTVTWDGKNESGREVATGIYLYIIEVDNKKILKRMTLIR